MKQIKITFKILTLLLFALLSITCEKDEENEECKKHEMPLIERQIVPTFSVSFKDGNPIWAAKIDFLIHKQYCDGSTPAGGYFSKQTSTNEDGFARLGYAFTYKFENRRDFVFYTVNITYQPASSTTELKYTIEDKLYYELVETPTSGVNNYDLHLSISTPWESSE